MKRFVFLGIFALINLALVKVSAQDLLVVDVKRNIPLSDDEPVYRDYYLNAGEGSSLKKNLVVNVKRKLTVKESATKSVGDFETTVGQLKIIHVGAKVAVAREFKLNSRDEEPMLEQIGIMAGDRVDTAGSFIDYTKPNYKKPKSAQSTESSGVKTETAKTATAPVDVVTTSTEVNNSQGAKTAKVDRVVDGMLDGRTTPRPTESDSTTTPSDKNESQQNSKIQNESANLENSNLKLRNPASEAQDEALNDSSDKKKPSLLEQIIPLPSSKPETQSIK